jgi:hypothetical protein
LTAFEVPTSTSIANGRYAAPMSGLKSSGFTNGTASRVSYGEARNKIARPAPPNTSCPRIL